MVPSVLIPDWEAEVALSEQGKVRGPGEGPMKEVKLGAIVGKKTMRSVPNLTDYLTDEFGAYQPPDRIDYSSQAVASLNKMLGNNRYGNCVIVGKAHQSGSWTGNDDTAGDQQPLVATEKECVDQYFKICGPGDNGCYIDRVLDYWMKNGLTFGGRLTKIDGFCEIDWTNKKLVQAAIHLLGGVTIGFDVPQEWANNARPDFLWKPTNSRTVGGHDVVLVGYDTEGVKVSTWGVVGTMAWDAMLSRRWVGECYSHKSDLWYGADKLAGSGINLAALEAAFKKIEQGQEPEPFPPGPGPLPPVPPIPPLPPLPPATQALLIDLAGTLNLPGGFGVPIVLKGRGVPGTSELFGAFPIWIIPILIKYGPYAVAILKVVREGREAGKSWGEILLDVLKIIERIPV